MTTSTTEILNEFEVAVAFTITQVIGNLEDRRNQLKTIGSEKANNEIHAIDVIRTQIEHFDNTAVKSIMDLVNSINVFNNE